MPIPTKYLLSRKTRVKSQFVNGSKSIHYDVVQE